VNRLQRKYAFVLAERERVGRELHDTLLQGMVGVALQVQSIAETLGPSTGTVRARLERARDCLEHYIRETRSSIWGLRSHTLETQSLPSALREAAESILASSEVAFQLRVRGRHVRGSSVVEDNVLKIALEAIFNAIRHGQPTTVDVSLEYESDRLVLRVSDDGIGFDLAGNAGRRESHWGLTTMQERARRIGSTLGIESSHSGTSIGLSVNLNAR
jgi:signal transduction histidine kinase